MYICYFTRTLNPNILRVLVFLDVTRDDGDILSPQGGGSYTMTKRAGKCRWKKGAFNFN